jgi:Flp pilus assembly protein TadB
MPQTMSGHRYPIAETLWILAAIILMLSFGDALTLLALAFAIVTMMTAWWIHRRVEHRVDRNDAELASVTHLRPAVTSQRIDAVNDRWRFPTPFGVGRKGYSITVIGLFIFAGAAALAAALTLTAPAQAGTIDTRFDICAALRNGTSLATIETTLEARGYSATNAGALTGTAIRQQCPDQAAAVMAQVQRAGA